MMRFKVQRMILPFLMLGMTMGGWGCAARNSQQDVFKEYRERLERQQTALASEEAASKKGPDLTPEGFEGLGDSYLRQGSMDMAFIQYNKALRLDPNQPRIRYKRGRLFLEKGLYAEAKSEFQEVLKVEPDHALACEGMGRAYFSMQEFPEAEKSFLLAIKYDSGQWQAHHFLGIIHDRRGEFDAA